jgi:hypothetical protein
VARIVHAFGALVAGLSSQDGVALPVAIAVLSVTLLLVNAAVMDVLPAGDSANRDGRAKRRIARLTYSPVIRDVRPPGDVQRVPGSYRECTPAAPAASEASGC